VDLNVIRREYHQTGEESGNKITTGHRKDKGSDTKSDKKGTTDKVKKK
jgi:hypothetical protein